ncbi:MAG: cell division protein FtsZ [Ferruginibacter sp.]|nr:cell division protein FtsZ [Ferruginibacter sp.]
MIQFDLPKEQSSIIKVIGVGGGGSNAVNHMFSQNIEGVNFIICNTDSQAIAQSKVPNKIQLGPHLTQGLGAGANPTIGRQATEESLDEIKRILEVNTKMAFITAGMGGGTGTGGAPIIAKICKELNILTVGIVTTPFGYEGKKRLAQADEGIKALKSNVDTLLIISNDKLRHQFGNLKMKEAFEKADNVLATAAKCITDVINTTGQINVDFADVCTVMKNGGVAILGSATAEGENRAQVAIENALNSPLLNDSDIKGAKWILININSAEGEHEFTMDEVEVIQNILLQQAGEGTDVILGIGYDNTLENKIGITLIATGFEREDSFAIKPPKELEENKVVLHLDLSDANKDATSNNLTSEENNVVENNGLSQPIELEIINNNTTASEQLPEVTTLASSFREEDPIEFTLTEINETDEFKSISEETKSENETPIFVEISTAKDHASESVIVFESFVSNTDELPQSDSKNELTLETKEETNNSNALSSGGYLVKPTQIYAEELPNIPVSQKNEEPLPVQPSMQEDEPAIEMQLVVNDLLNAVEEPVVQQTPPKLNPSVEEPALQDETEELRRRARERIAKLRNLSFNTASDPNSEFETVPAYLRRNMDIHNQIADVETFYSNYTVKTNDKNQTVLSSFNTFLEGKKPD